MSTGTVPASLADQARAAAQSVEDALERAASAFRDAFRTARAAASE